MTDLEHKDLEEQTPVQERPPQEAPASETASIPEASPAFSGESAPYSGHVPHLTLDPNEIPPAGDSGHIPVEDPFQSPEPPRAPEPPRPDYQQPPQYEAPQYGAPQYGPPQYGAPQYQPPQYTQPPQQPYYQPQYSVPPVGYNQKSRLAAGLLGVLLGCLGIHNFYLGFTGRGTIQLVVSLVGGLFTCGLATVAMVIWGFIEGVLILCASPSRMYDGHGVILRD